MRITLRLIVSLVFAATATVFIFTAFQAREDQARLEDELRRQSRTLGDSLQQSIELLLATEHTSDLRLLVDRFGNREHLVGVGVYTTEGQPLAITESLSSAFRIPPRIAREAMGTNESREAFQTQEQRRRYLQALPLHLQGTVKGAVLLVHDASYIDIHRARLWREDALRLLLHVFLISLTTLAILGWGFLRPLAKMVAWIRTLRTGEAMSSLHLPKEGLFAPLAREVTHMAKSLQSARSAAEEEARLRIAGESRWTPERLQEHVRTILKGRPLIVVSNREPYIHVRAGRQVQCLVPPGGLVTAMEAVLRACGGTWIAHGSGDADRDTADTSGRLKVPPEAPRYLLRRVWLEQAEEQGYYYGFSNEGLWPLCHIAHTRPIFRAEDWEQYRRVNAKFADTIVEEFDQMDQPCLLIQDYHFALLPRLVKAKRPDAKIALFWHIPWPNPEAFSICPWGKELLHGMLGADLLGFHIQFHCNNFLDTVDRMLESRIDWEQFAITRADHTTWVKPFPISIAGTDAPMTEEADTAATQATAKAQLLKSFNMQVNWLGVGVDRLDYTKGLIERFLAIERFLEKYPTFQGRFTFIELGAPSRTPILRYQELTTELEAQIERINQRFQTRTWKPLVFLKKQHSHDAIAPFYRAADVCMVTSLHDGMNLVSKEFVAARTDQRGVLILSQFTGASRELRDALIVNPYDIDQMAEALHYALTMDTQEQTARMSRMRETIQEHNIYRWASNLVTELTRLRPDASPMASQAPLKTG